MEQTEIVKIWAFRCYHDNHHCGSCSEPSDYSVHRIEAKEGQTLDSPEFRQLIMEHLANTSCRSGHKWELQLCSMVKLADKKFYLCELDGYYDGTESFYPLHEDHTKEFPNLIEELQQSDLFKNLIQKNKLAKEEAEKKKQEEYEAKQKETRKAQFEQLRKEFEI